MSGRRKGKARKNVMPHRCVMCHLGAPKRGNKKDRLPFRDRRKAK